MIEFDFRPGDPHHYYHIRARDAAQAERIRAYIRQRVAAEDPYLQRAPAIDGARISTQRRPSRSPAVSRPAPRPSAIRRYGSLAWEGAKRGLVDTAESVADASRVITGQQLADRMVAAAYPKEQAAYHAAYPTAAEYIQRAAQRLGVIHPNIRANTTAERYVLDGSRFIGGSIVPGVGLESTGTRVLGRLATGATVLAGAGGSVAGGDLAEHYGLPRPVGEFLGGLAAGGSAALGRNPAIPAFGRSKLLGGARGQLPLQPSHVGQAVAPAAEIRPNALGLEPTGSRSAGDPHFSYGRDRHNAGLVLRDGVPVAAPRGNAYSVAYEVPLERRYFLAPRWIHKHQANRALDEAVQKDPEVASMMEELAPGSPVSVASKGRRRTPTNWLWHHDRREGIMQLVPQWQHEDPRFWYTFHPDGVGGNSLWGLPSLARQRAIATYAQPGRDQH